MFTYPERQAIARSMAEEHFRINSHTQAEKDAFIAGVVAGIGLIERVDAQNALDEIDERIAGRGKPPKTWDTAEEAAPNDRPETLQAEETPRIVLATASTQPKNDKDVSGYITYRMARRWLPHFIAMLKTMQSFGNAGHSGNVAFYADGDGDFRPKFSFYVSTIPVDKVIPPLPEPKAKKTNATLEDVTLYDAG